MTKPILEVQKLNVEFPSKTSSVVAIKDVSFNLALGEILGIVGESGSGKSVTYLAIIGLLPATAKISGNILFDNRHTYPNKPVN